MRLFMTHLECYILYLQAQHIEIVSNIWNYAACDGSCYMCPARPACNYLSDLSTINFSEGFYKVLLPFKDKYSQFTLKQIQQTNPEYFI